MNNIKQHLRKYLTLTLALLLTVLSANSLIQPVYASSQAPVYVLATDADFSGTQDGEFRYIGKATHVRIPHVIKGVPVTSYASMFSHTNVEGVYSDNRNVTDMSWMFYNSQASSLDLSKLDTRNVTDMSWMLACTKSKTIDLSGFSTANVADMSYMFYDAKVKNLDLSNFDLSNLTNSERIFANSDIAVVDMRTFTFEQLKTHGQHLIKSLTSGAAPTIYLGSQALIDKLSLEDGYFFGTYAGRTALVKQDGRPKPSRPFVFFNSPGVVMVNNTIYTIPDELPPGYELATDDDFIVYPPTNYPASWLTGSYRFQYVGTKPYVFIPDKINGYSLKLTDYWGMFSGEDAKHVRGVASNNHRITSMAFMFADNPSPSLDLRYLVTDNVTDMTGMFSGNQATSINLSSFNTKNVVSMHQMFANSKVKNLDLDHFHFTHLMGADGMFEGAKATSVKMKNFNLANSGKQNSWISYGSIAYMFKDSAVKSIDLSSLRLDSYYYDSRPIDDAVFDWLGEPVKVGGQLWLRSHDVFKDSSLNTIYVGDSRVKELLESNKPAGLKIVVR